MRSTKTRRHEGKRILGRHPRNQTCGNAGDQGRSQEPAPRTHPNQQAASGDRHANQRERVPIGESLESSASRDLCHSEHRVIGRRRKCGRPRKLG